MLRNAPRLYEIMKWAREENLPRLKYAVQDFDILRRKLRHALITAHCAQRDCHQHPCSMTFPVDREGWCRPSPYSWCNKHGPSEKRKISQKYAIHFDVIMLMKTDAEKGIIFKELRIAFGIKPGTRITNEFAHRFFANLD